MTQNKINIIVTELTLDLMKATDELQTTLQSTDNSSSNLIFLIKQNLANVVYAENNLNKFRALLETNNDTAKTTTTNE